MAQPRGWGEEVSHTTPIAAFPKVTREAYLVQGRGGKETSPPNTLTNYFVTINVMAGT